MTFCIPFATGFNKPVVSSSPYTSIQQITGTIPASDDSVDVTISSVNTAFSTIMWEGFTSGNEDIRAYSTGAVQLINGTTLRFTRGSALAAAALVFKVTVVEWSSDWVDTIQRGTIAIANPATSNTATITSVDTSRSYVAFLGNYSSNVANITSLAGWPLLALTNATTVTATVQVAEQALGTITVSYEVVQFKAAKVRSLQYATFAGANAATTQDVTISSVIEADCMIIPAGFNSSSTSSTRGCLTSQLTSPTNVRFEKGVATSTTTNIAVFVVELISTFASVENIETSGYVTSGTSVADTITSIDTSKSFLTFNGIKTGTIAVITNWNSNVEYTNATTATFTRVGTSTLATQSIKARSHTFAT